MIPTLDPPAGALLNITASVDRDQVVLALIGEIDITNADQLVMCTRGYLDEAHINQVTLDLRALTFIDASGLRTLILCRRHADELGKTFLIQNHHGHIAELIGIVGLTKFLTDPTSRLK